MFLNWIQLTIRRFIYCFHIFVLSNCIQFSITIEEIRAIDRVLLTLHCFDSCDIETLQRRGSWERKEGEGDWDALDVNRKRAEGTAGTTSKCVCVCVCVCVWLIGGSIWGSIHILTAWLNYAIVPYHTTSFCLTPCATPNPLPTLHIIQLDKFPFFLTVLPACIPLFILLNFCPTPTELLSKSFSRHSLTDLHEWLQWVEPRLFDGQLSWCGGFSPGSIPRAGMPSRRKAPMATRTAQTMTPAPLYRSLLTLLIR